MAICDESEHWVDVVKKRHDEIIQKARNYVGFGEQARYVSSRSG